MTKARVRALGSAVWESNRFLGQGQGLPHHVGPMALLVLTGAAPNWGH